DSASAAQIPLRSDLAVLVAEDPEERSAAGLRGGAGHHRDLAAVGILDRLDAHVAVGDDEVAHRLVATVLNLVRAVRPGRKVDDLAVLELPFARRRPERRAAAENHEQLLRAVVEVIEPARGTRRQL